MGGGLMQLVAYGAQDIYLTGNPQITFFKVVYRRHTNFSMESIQQTLNGATTTSATAGGTATCTISRNGDLVHKVYVTGRGAPNVDAPDQFVAEAEIEIGGQSIDKQTRQWREVWNELSTPDSKAMGLKSMQGAIGHVLARGDASRTGVHQIHVPLTFWFCRNPGLALPLIALQYHEVKIKLTWGSTGANLSPNVWCDYIYLDTDERRRFAQVSHEYLIEQVQESDLVASGVSNLHFNHPVKELIWVSTDTTTYDTALLKLNGHDRFSARESEYFQLQQPYDFHTAVPRQNLPHAAQAGTVDWDYEIAGSKAAGARAFSSLDLDFAVTGTLNANQLTSQAIAANLSLGNPVFCGSFNGGPLGGHVPLLATATLVGGAGGNVSPHDKAPTQVGLIMVNADAIAAGFTIANIGKPFILNIKSASVNGGTADGEPIRIPVILNGVQIGTGTGGVGFPANDVTVVSFDRNIWTHGASALAHDISSAANDDNPAETTDITTGFEITDIQVLNANHFGDTQARTSKMTAQINVYSFALKPEEHQPSGTCNFSRIDNAQLIFTGSAPTGKIYAVNYNVLRIMSGMGGLAYSN